MKKALSVIFVLATSLISPVALSKPPFLNTFKALYGIKPDSKLGKAGCQICHVPDGPPKRNSYGEQVHSALEKAQAMDVTNAILQSIEALPSGAPGKTNLQAIQSDAPPGANTNMPEVNDPTPPDRPELQKLALPRHAQHPLLVHFPIALVLVAFALQLGKRFLKQDELGIASRVNLGLAALSSPLALLSGLGAWKFLLGGVPFAGTLLVHLAAGILATLATIMLWFRARTQRDWDRVSWMLAVIAVIATALAGHFGGYLSGVAGGA